MTESSREGEAPVSDSPDTHQEESSPRFFVTPISPATEALLHQALKEAPVTQKSFDAARTTIGNLCGCYMDGEKFAARGFRNRETAALAIHYLLGSLSEVAEAGSPVRSYRRYNGALVEGLWRMNACPVDCRQAVEDIENACQRHGLDLQAVNLSR